MPRKTYRRSRAADAVKRTPEQKILEYMLSIKEQVLERETLPFDVGRFAYLPYNAFTKRQYTGMHNLIMLMIGAFQYGWTDPRFVTVGKAKEIGADFRGRRTTPLWAPVTVSEIDEETGEKKVKGVRFRAFRVFNVEQFRNREELNIPPLPRSRWGDTPVMERIEEVKEHALTNFRKSPLFIEQPLVRASHYRPNTHEIVLPPPAEYRDPGRFVQSLLHEVAHATGASSELKRFKRQEDGGFCGFDKKEYAYEEMLTQFATAFLVTHYGFEHESKRSSDYILSWYRVIEDRPDALGNAIRSAMSVVKFITRDNPLPDYSEDAEDDACELARAA